MKNVNSQFEKIQRAAFTLVELLVTLAVLLVLAGLVIGPGLKVLKESTASATCVNNLRQIGTAFYSFAGEHSGEFPPISGDAAGATADEQNGKGSQWDVQLTPYLGIPDNKKNVPLKKTVYYCPASEGDPSYAKKAVVLLSYTYNVNVGRTSASSPGIRLGTGQNLSSVVLLADLQLASSTASISYVPQTGQGKNNTIIFRPGAGYYPLLAPRHKGQMNVLFLDGHVAPRMRLVEGEKTSPPENVRWTSTGELTGVRQP